MAEFEPSNDIEQALLDAALEDDRQSYFQLIAVSDLFLPQVTGDPAGGQQFVTVQMLDQTFLPVFTSWQLIAEQFRGVVDGYTITNYPELSRKWPDPQWRLAINPGTPLDAYLSIEGVADAAVGDVALPTLREMAEVAAEDEETEQRLQERHAATNPADLAEAAAAADAYGYAEQLLATVVLVPAGRSVESDAILDPGFPWRPATDEKVIEVFTTREAFARVHPETVPAVEVAMPFVLAVWPEDHGLSINPGGDDAVAFEAEQVLLLLTFAADD